MSSSDSAAITRSPSKSPYSDSFQPFLTAISLMATLCSLEPVKYCIAAPHEPAGTTRRSTCMPDVVRIEVFLSPEAMTSAT